MKTLDIEIALAEYFNSRRNLIVPNVWWGMEFNECDLLILTPSGYATEVEIKITLQDLKRDSIKKHSHMNEKIKYLYFALPEDLKKYQYLIPREAGLLIIKEFEVEKIKDSEIKSKYRFTAQEKFNLARLGAMRIWNLKRKLKKIKEEKRKC